MAQLRPMLPVRYAEDGTPLHPITGDPMVEVEPGVWQEPMVAHWRGAMAEAAASMVKVMDRALRYPWLRRFESPWPDAGFNPHTFTFPELEPDYCDECGNPLDRD